MEPFRLPTSKPQADESTPLRPAMRRLRPPEAVCVTVRTGRPAIFIFRAQRYAVEYAYGPWRASGDWWNQTLWGYEQWDLIARASDDVFLCCCLIRDLLREQWQMAALYD